MPSKPAKAENPALEEMPYGLYIIGSKSDEGVNAMMADWVMQVSFVPCLVAVSLENDARTLENIRATKVFSVNLLADDSMELAAKFAQPYYGSKIKGRSETAAAEIHRKLEGIPFTTGKTGCPVLEEALAWFECEVEQFVSAGDHTLAIGRNVNGEVVRDAKPLTSEVTGWQYGG
jgi:flavin reductase (DIM6/NTAB) family NADH-FMN oxidoreductase RutF